MTTASSSSRLRLVYVSGGRSDYSLMRPVLRLLAARPSVTVAIVVTGMHLERTFGRTVALIEADGHRIAARVPVRAADDSAAEMVQVFGATVRGLATALERVAADAVLLQGDRDETLAAAIVAAHLGLPIIHMGGGDISGGIDDANRNAISHFAGLHLVGTPRAAARLRAFGIASGSIHVVGEPGLDDVVGRPGARRSEPLILLTQHPVLGEGEPRSQMRETIAALEDVGVPVFATYPNSDAGGRAMLDELLHAVARHPDWTVVASAPSADAYIDLLRSASVMVGNSSSGIVEAPTAGLPVVNVGGRQDGRLRAANVVDVGYDRAAIARALRKQLAVARRRSHRPYRSPYGDGTAGRRSVRAIEGWWRSRRRSIAGA